jgi:hypothetical protein
MTQTEYNQAVLLYTLKQQKNQVDAAIQCHNVQGAALSVYGTNSMGQGVSAVVELATVATDMLTALTNRQSALQIELDNLITMLGGTITP